MHMHKLKKSCSTVNSCNLLTLIQFNVNSILILLFYINKNHQVLIIKNIFFFSFHIYKFFHFYTSL